MMMDIDGSMGEGGGQIVRSALALALVTGRPLTLRRIRARRRRPGLQRQHLVAVRAAAEVSRADVRGDVLGSSELTFRPHELRGGEYRFEIGSAGSTSLVLQTVLPALLAAPENSRVTLLGGTHNPLAPPFEFLAESFLPVLARMGPRVTAVLERPGFYPVGGGKAVFEVHPSKTWSGLELLERGSVGSHEMQARVARLPRHIAERECQTFQSLSQWPAASVTAHEVFGSRGPGNIVLAWLRFERVTEVLAAFGQKGVRAEQVAAHLWQQVDAYQAAQAPVGEHLADQLLLPLCLAAVHHGQASTFRATTLSSHAETQIQLLQEQLPVVIQSRDVPTGCEVQVTAAR